MARSKYVGYTDPYQLSASELRFQVVIMERKLTQDSALGFSQMWKPISKLPTMPAAIRPASAREMTIAQQQNQSISHIVKMRFRKDVTDRNMLKFNGRVLSIMSVINMMRMATMTVLRAITQHIGIGCWCMWLASGPLVGS